AHFNVFSVLLPITDVKGGLPYVMVISTVPCQPMEVDSAVSVTVPAAPPWVRLGMLGGTKSETSKNVSYCALIMATIEATVKGLTSNKLTLLCNTERSMRV